MIPANSASLACGSRAPLSVRAAQPRPAVGERHPSALAEEAGAREAAPVEGDSRKRSRGPRSGGKTCSLRRENRAEEVIRERDRGMECDHVRGKSKVQRPTAHQRGYGKGPQRARQGEPQRDG